jgi:hypothetical protein
MPNFDRPDLVMYVLSALDVPIDGFRNARQGYERDDLSLVCDHYYLYKRLTTLAIVLNRRESYW